MILYVICLQSYTWVCGSYHAHLQGLPHKAVCYTFPLLLRHLSQDSLHLRLLLCVCLDKFVSLEVCLLKAGQAYLRNTASECLN